MNKGFVFCENIFVKFINFVSGNESPLIYDLLPNVSGYYYDVFTFNCP